MALDLVTGYKGEAHITAENVGAFNAGVFGSGEYVLNSGNKLAASLTSNNTVKILDGDLVMHGRHITLKKGTFEEVTIENGVSGENRNDLIVARYTKDSNTGVENVSFAVIKGASTAGVATDPEYTTGDILSGDCTLHEMPLYRVTLTGLTAGAPEALFKFVNCFNNGFIPYETPEEDLPSKWISLGHGIWQVPRDNGKLISRNYLASGATLFNSFAKLMNEDDHRVQVTQILLSGKTSGIDFRIGTLNKESGVDSFGEWKSVKLNYENPVVSGEYTGDGEESMFVELGFVPKAVLVTRTDGSMARSHWGSELGSYFYGGLSVSSSDCRFWNGTSDFPIVRITSINGGLSGGFTVYNSSYVNGSGSAHVATNEKSKYHYIAFKN